MLDLILVLTPIALLDSMSVVPTALIPMAMLLAGRRPVAGTLAFIAGIFVTYLPFGLLVAFGLDSLFEQFGQWLYAAWNRPPDSIELWVQIGIGLALIVFGHQLCGGRKSTTQQKAPEMGPGAAFVLAAVINLSGIWGALPYFAAIAQIIKTDIDPTGMSLALLYYNLIFVLPLLVFIPLRMMLGERADAILSALTEFFAKWGKKLLMTLLIGFGFLLIADAVGWFNGHPLLPVSEETINAFRAAREAGG